MAPVRLFATIVTILVVRRIVYVGTIVRVVVQSALLRVEIAYVMNLFELKL